MTKHPLTDEMCLELSAFTLDIIAEDWAEWQREDMRSAADWQLDQVIKWAQRNCWCWFEKSSQKKSFIVELEKAMRPQEDN